MLEPNHTIASAIKTARESTRDLRWLRASMITLFATLLTSVPVAAQVDSVDAARNAEGIPILQSFVFFLMAVVPILALIIVLASFAVLMSTRDPQKKSNWKNVRNQAVLYGWIIVPALGVIISLLATLTGNPVLEGMDI